MKKIYASMLVLAMGTCITAGARTYQCANISFDGRSVKTYEMAGNLIKSDKTISKMAKVKAYAGDGWTTLGDNATLIDGMFTGEELTVTVEESVSTPGYYSVPNYYSQFSESTMPFDIDATDPTCVYIPEQETGLSVNFTLSDGTQVSGPLTIFSFSEYYRINGLTVEELREDAPELIITMENGIVDFPEGSILGLVGNYEKPIMLNDQMELYMPGVEYVPEWGEIRTGKMLDTFFEAGFRDYEAVECDVLIQKNNRVDGVYRIIDPWYRLFGDAAPAEDAGYYFYFDASNPDCIVVPYQTSYVNTSDGPVYVLSLSALYETTEEFLASEDAAGNFKMDTETNTINFTGSEVQLTDGSTTFVGPLFFVYPKSANPNSLYVLRPYETPGYIKLPEFNGISNVAVDNNNAKAEYYNIQGVRVNNPVSGQLYIVKKGNEVSKQVVR